MIVTHEIFTEGLTSTRPEPLATSIYTAPLAHTAHSPSLPIEEAAHQGVHAVFRVLPSAAAHKVMYQLKRQDRAVFLLLDGRRTIRDVAQLVHRSELSVARVLAHLLKSGYIECVQVQDEHGELNVARTLAHLFSNP